ESRVYRGWGMDVIGMTNMPEAKLAREAELCYATLALATDYDVWHETHAAVSVEAVVQNLLKNVATAREVLRAVIPTLAPPGSSRQWARTFRRRTAGSSRTAAWTSAASRRRRGGPSAGWGSTATT